MQEVFDELRSALHTVWNRRWTLNSASRCGSGSRTVPWSVAVRAATHVCAVIPNLLMQEFPGSRPDHAWTHELIDPTADVRDGELVVPEGPGLGFSVEEKNSRRSASAERGPALLPPISVAHLVCWQKIG